MLLRCQNTALTDRVLELWKVCMMEPIFSFVTMLTIGKQQKYSVHIFTKRNQVCSIVVFFINIPVSVPTFIDKNSIIYKKLNVLSILSQMTDANYKLKVSALQPTASASESQHRVAGVGERIWCQSETQNADLAMIRPPRNRNAVQLRRALQQKLDRRGQRSK